MRLGLSVQLARNGLFFACWVLFFAAAEVQAYIDVQHDSQVFGEQRNYRVLLPAGYDSDPSTTYPVVYYFHGWNERYNSPVHGEIPIGDLDAFVAANDNHLVVIPDGSMNPGATSPNIRPYNIGENHADDRGTPFDVQYTDYFLELLDDVDSRFRTVAGREGRGLFGYSMGGFMAYNLAGKHPQHVSALVDHLGSPEFYVGDPDRRVLYKKRDMIGNLHGVQVRLQAGSQDFLRFLNAELHESFQRDPTIDFEYELNNSDHALAALDDPLENFSEGIGFLLDAFADPSTRPDRWHHTDTYAAFDKWGYEVTSDLTDPGLLALRGVTQGGFEVGAVKWTGGGPYMPGVQVDVLTDAIYEPNTQYDVLDYNVAQGTASTSLLTSDSLGRITVSSNGEPHQFGVYRDGDPAELVVVGQRVNESGQFFTQGQPGALRLQLLNRGGSQSSGLTATISTAEPNVTINNPTIALDDLGSGDAAWSPEIHITPDKAAPTNRIDHRIRFDIEFSDGRHEEVFVSQYFDAPEIEDIWVDDGRPRIVNPFGGGGIAYGEGNGDGLVDPGEKVYLYTDATTRLRLFTDDPNVEWLEEEQVSQLLPSTSGPDFRLTSVVKISEDALPGTQIRFLANYETKESVSNPIRPVVHWGYVTLTVEGVPEPTSALLGAAAIGPLAISARRGRDRRATLAKDS